MTIATRREPLFFQNGSAKLEKKKFAISGNGCRWRWRLGSAWDGRQSGSQAASHPAQITEIVLPRPLLKPRVGRQTAFNAVPGGFLLPILWTFRAWQSRFALLPGRPINRDHADEDESQSDFRFDIGQPFGKPPRGNVVPINERRMASNEISVNPEGRAY